MDGSYSKPRHKIRKTAPAGAKSLSNNYEITPKARLWLASNGETYLAPGRITLLERIEEYGSITRAAKSMEMSYRHAWMLLEDMNSKAPAPLVIKVSGGKGGGGSSLSAEGKKAVKEFNALQEKLRLFIEEL